MLPTYLYIYIYIYIYIYTHIYFVEICSHFFGAQMLCSTVMFQTAILQLFSSRKFRKDPDRVNIGHPFQSITSCKFCPNSLNINLKLQLYSQYCTKLSYLIISLSQLIKTSQVYILHVFYVKINRYSVVSMNYHSKHQNFQLHFESS